MNILVVTLGTSWAVVPELLAFTNIHEFPLYNVHPRRDQLIGFAEEEGLEPVGECRVVTTCDERTLHGVDLLREWLRRSGSPVKLRVWHSRTVSELNDSVQCRQMRDLILRVVLHAREACGDGRLALSLAGGRKTMSADMQHAAQLFGCHHLLHVTAREPLPRELVNGGVELFLGSLSSELADTLFPMMVGGYPRNPLPDVSNREAGERVCGTRYPLPSAPGDGTPVAVPPETALEENLSGRLRRAQHLLFNFTKGLTEGEPTNFQALYGLPPLLIEGLRGTFLGVDPGSREKELRWLEQLPKAELHCHLGGIADAWEMVEIAAANRRELLLYQGHPGLEEWLNLFRPLVRKGDARGLRRALAVNGEPDFKAIRQVFPGIPQPLCVAAFLLLFEGAEELLDALVFGELLEEGRFVGGGIVRYEQLGDLQGSALLQSEASLRAACRVVLRQCGKSNVRYLELRCSPAKYTRGGLSEMDVVRILREELACGEVRCALVFIASRHGAQEELEKHVRLARELLEGDGAWAPVPLVGFDLAGNESIRSARELRRDFMPLMEKCMHLTIHAGETEDVRSVWEAVYDLNAERIGHGLNLHRQRELMERCLDRRTTLELCPSSNRQIVGFRENGEERSDLPRVYPLGEYLKTGLRVTVNTDNPGISRTDLTREYHRAARLTPGGLSQWEVIQLVRNGFRGAFVSHAERKRLLVAAESRVCELLEKEL